MPCVDLYLMISVVLGYLAMLGFILVIVGMLFPMKLFSYQAVVKEKKVRYSAWWGMREPRLITPEDTPDHEYILITEKNQKVETSQNLYESIKVGDTITVTFFSDWVHRLIEKDARADAELDVHPDGDRYREFLKNRAGNEQQKDDSEKKKTKRRNRMVR